MRSTRESFIVLIVLCLHSFTYAQTKSDDITGIWLTPENRSAIQIFQKGDRYFGKIIWEKEPKDKYGELKRDINNPDPKKRDQTLNGLIILKDLRYDGKKEWIKGNIYNPETGNTYKIKAELINKNTLKIRGYVGLSLLGKSSVWRRKTQII
jgi:uncharacterized protein (DUF2147 family)